MSKARDNATVSSKILQVVNSSSTTRTDVLSTSYIQVGGSALTATITPKSTANKILVTAHVALYSPNAGNGYMAIYRNGVIVSEYGYYQYQAGEFNYGTVSFLDSPSSTSSTVYSVYARGGTTAAFYINYSDGGGQVKSSITAMEVAG